MRRNPQGTFPVVRSGAYVGVVDVATIDRAPAATAAGELADGMAETLAPDDDLESDISALATARTHAVPVVDRGRVVGLLRLDEVNQLVVGRNPGGSVAGSE